MDLWMLIGWSQNGMSLGSRGGGGFSGHNSVSLGARDQTLGLVHRKEIPELSHQPYDMSLLK